MVRAEGRIEDALSDLRAKRHAWMEARQQNQTPAQIRALRRTMLKAQRSIKASLSEWEQMMSPLGRICEPDEVAAAIHFLSSNDCGFINGQALTLCGGLSVGVNDRARRKLAMSLEEVGHE